MQNILVVDDEEDIRVLVKTILENEGYKVLTADDGEQALKILDKEKIDLVLLDVMMPGMSGWAVVGEMMKKPYIKDVSIAMLTVKTMEPEHYYSEESEGLVDYINKPFTNRDLVTRVKNIFESVTRIDDVKERLQSTAPALSEEYEELVRLERLYANLKKSLEFSMKKSDEASADFQHMKEAVEYGEVLLSQIRTKKEEYEKIIGL